MSQVPGNGQPGGKRIVLEDLAHIVKDPKFGRSENSIQKLLFSGDFRRKSECTERPSSKWHCLSS